jgi:hypothetical protein
MLSICLTIIIAVSSVCATAAEYPLHLDSAWINEVVSTDTATLFSDYAYLTESTAEPSWVAELIRAIEPAASQTPGADNPYIMLAGYMDTDLSESEGGLLSILAYVSPVGAPIDIVEIYWDGDPTGAFLYDDGAHGDFGSFDGLWGVMFEVGSNVIPAGEYMLELRARDQNGLYSDLWPYLTIHP